jgi:hypothetical protein
VSTQPEARHLVSCIVLRVNCAKLFWEKDEPGIGSFPCRFRKAE